MESTSGEISGGQLSGGQVSLRRALLGPFTTLSLGAAAIHFAVTDAHFQEWWAFGLFFAAVGWFQALWPIAYLLMPGVRTAVLGAIVNLATVGVWVYSRTAGLPFGPGAGQPEAIGAPDILASVFELLLVVGLVLIALGPVRRKTFEQRVAASTSFAWAAALALAVVVSTSAAITMGMQ